MTTPTSFPHGLQRLVFESRNLKEHALRATNLDAMLLSSALLPFDRDPDFAEVADADIQTLNEAFQQTFAQAQLVIEERTLNNVLAGRSPLLAARTTLAQCALICNNAVLTSIAILLVLGAFHYSTWISNSSTAIADADTFLAFDNAAKINRLIELQHIFEQSDADTDPIANPILQTYLEEAAELEQQYFTEIELPSRLYDLTANVNPIRPIILRFGEHACDFKGEGFSFMQRVIFGCEPPRPMANLRLQLSEPDVVIGPRVQSDNDFGIALRAVEESRRQIMRSFGRTPQNSYRQTRYVVGSRTQALREKLSLIYLWALPVIYGALGSAVYSMWCMMSSHVSNHRIFYFTVRMIFGSLAALTFSMLVVPTNLLSIGTDLNRPLVYLMAFIFGYSIETFINVLNQINSYIADHVTIGKKG